MQVPEIKNPYANVVFPIPVRNTYTYIVPERFADEIEPGVRVLAPFGHRKMTGFVISRSDTSDYAKLKSIEEVLDPVPLFTPEVLSLSLWIAEYYVCGWGEVLKAALPSGIHLNSERLLRLVHDDPYRLAESLTTRSPRQAEIIKRLAGANPMPYKKLQNAMSGGSFYSSLKRLRQEGYVRMELALPSARVGIKEITLVKIPDRYTHEDLDHIMADLEVPAPKQAACLRVLMENHDQDYTRARLARAASTTPAAVNALVEKELLVLETQEVIRDYYSSMQVAPPKAIILNNDQERVVARTCEAIRSNQNTTFVLHGVTGSGKTQVYIEAIYEALKQDKSAVVLVPEISLTPQMVRRFRAHFGDQVAVFHSRMSPGERYDSWRKTWEGKHKIVIGPRSAIFAPLSNLGLIVVDEEHEPSFKQSDLTPRYHARDVAVVRGTLHNAVVMLGSATPSVETHYNARIGKYELLELPKRIDDVPMPAVELVDMKREPKIIGRTDPIIFSRKLRSKIDEKLSRGEQIILFLNRRGFAPVFKCKTCGYSAQCKDCDIAMTYHLSGTRLKCHYCGYTRRAPEKCPECGGSDVLFRGIGTQRVEEELHTLFPGVKAMRMDLDTTRGRMAHDKLLGQFGKGEYQVLLGTQMVAKGLDFPNVTLVGVISADTELYLPDFRSAERTFQLITQVAGRAGRKDKLGEVVVQSFSPEHYSLQYAKNHQFTHFFNAEIVDRQGLMYPPFSRLINILFKGENADKVKWVAEAFAKGIPERDGYQILGPVTAPLARLQKNYRWHLVFKIDRTAEKTGKNLKEAIHNILAELKKTKKLADVSVSIDVDPASLL